MLLFNVVFMSLLRFFTLTPRLRYKLEGPVRGASATSATVTAAGGSWVSWKGPFDWTARASLLAGFGLSALLLALAPVPAFATAYYVDSQSGNDQWAGTSTATAWRTISKVNTSSFAPGDQVLFRRGRLWREQLTVPSSGSQASPITFGAYGTGPNPVFSGANLVAGWQSIGGNAWRATLATQPSAVFLDGTRGVDRGWQGGLQIEGDWYWSSGFLHVYSSQDPDTGYSAPGIEAAVRASGVLSRRSHVIIQDLETRHATGGGVYAKADNGLTLTGITIRRIYAHDNSTTGISALNLHSDAQHPLTNVHIEACSSLRNGYHGIAMGGDVRNSTIRNNTVSDNGHEGTGWHGISTWGPSSTVRPSGITIEGNNVSGTRIGPGSTEGTGIQADNNSAQITMRYNYVHDNEGPGIELHKSEYCDVYYNLIVRNGSQHASGSGILVEEGRYSNLFNNVIVGNQRFGIYVFDPFTFTTFNTNVVNNIFSNNAEVELRVFREGSAADATVGFVSDNNLFHHQAGSAYLQWAEFPLKDLQGWQNLNGRDGNSIEADPLFENPQDDGFRLQTLSPAHDAGMLLGLSRDFAGQLVPQGLGAEIGAYEVATSLFGDGFESGDTLAWSQTVY